MEVPGEKYKTEHTCKNPAVKTETVLRCSCHNEIYLFFLKQTSFIARVMYLSMNLKLIEMLAFQVKTVLSASYL